MKSRKDKSKKKKKNQKSKDEWTHDGGIVFDTKNRKNDDNGISKRRKTQEHDEKMRRGRRKMFENNIKQKVVHKMSKKITFDDVIKRHNPILNTSSDSDDKVQLKKVDNAVKKSTSDQDIFDPYNVMNALNRLIKSDQKNRKPLLSLKTLYNVNKTNERNPKESESNIRSNFTEVDDDNQSDLINSDSTTNDDSNNDKNLNEPNEQDVEDDDDEVNDESCYKWFFTYEDDTDSNHKTNKNSNESSQMVTTNHHQSLQKLDITNTLKNSSTKHELNSYYELYGHVSQTHYLKPIATLADIPTLPKLFKSRRCEIIPTEIEKILLPYFSTYLDAFIEYDHIGLKNDTSIMNAMMLHIVIHTIKARLVY